MPSPFKFNELPLPDVERGSFKEQKCLISFKGKLALSILGEQPHGTLISIWVMREYGVYESWNKLCVVSAENTVFVVSNKILTRLIGFTKDGPLLIQKNYKKTKRSRLKNKMRSISTYFSWFSLSIGFYLSLAFVEVINLVKDLFSSLEGCDMNKNYVELFFWFLAFLRASRLGCPNIFLESKHTKYKLQQPL
uniref:F-box associated domain-containing protein n=1 Tax=Quercus lobata TaxID=97700 RepID=A0A7N2LFQ8_QUELO